MSRTPLAGIDRQLAKAAERQELPGVVALAATADTLLYAGAQGRRSLAHEAPMTLDTVFWLASMTKAVTATAAMQLIEQGQLTLETPVASILPILGEVPVLTGFDAAGQPRLRSPKRPITIHHLLTHTAGFSYEMISPALLRYRAVADKVPYTARAKAAGIPSALALPLLFDPGERWEYSISMDWLGRVIEAVTGEQLGDYFHHAIFEPLGMHDTSFALSPSQVGRLAIMHNRQADGTLTVADFTMPTAPRTHSGGGGLSGTGPDYLRFLQLFLQQGTVNSQRILAPETVALMARNQLGGLTVQPMRSALPETLYDVDFYPNMAQGWGYSFLVNLEPSAQGRSAGSLAWAGLGNTYYWIDLKRGIAGLFLTQVKPFFDPIVLTHFRAFEQLINERH